MKFFLKPSWTLFFIGVGILLFVIGLVAVYALTGKTENELFSGYLQNTQADSPQSKPVYAAPSQRFTATVSDKNFACGVIERDDIVFSLYDSTDNSQLLRLEDVRSLELRENIWPANREMCELIIPITATLPQDIDVGTKLEGRLEGSLYYQESSVTSSNEVEKSISQSFAVEVIDQTDLLSQIRKQPLLIMIFSFPLAIILIVLGARSELYGSKRPNKASASK